MKVELRLGGLITLAGRDLALGQTHAILDGIATERSVSGAAARLGLSYRAAWGRILATEEALGRPIAVKTKGHGSVLTPFGAALRDALAATLRAFEPALEAEERALGARLAALLGRPAPRRLAISHDEILSQVLSAMPDLSVSVVGSEEAVGRLRSGRADAAGFHEGTLGAPLAPAFAELWQDAAFVTRPLFTRQQGLIVAPGNPLAIASVADLAATGARFVNRQKGSGTRAWLDRLLVERHIPAEAIRGYDVEEFTHQAVAALVASGVADAGMGACLVAERFGLGFVPIGAETYFLAARAEHADLVAAVAAGACAAIAGVSGYDTIFLDPPTKKAQVT